MTFYSTPLKKAFLLIFAGLCTATPLIAQQAEVRFPAAELSAGSMIREIENQTNIIFGFERAAFDTTRIIRLPQQSLLLEEALTQLTRQNEAAFIRRGNVVVLSPRPAPKPEPARARTADRYRPSDQSELAAAWAERPAAAEPAPVAEPNPLPEPPAPYSTYNNPDLYPAIAGALPRWAVKINALYGAAALTPNIGVELATGHRQSIELTAGYNPWNRKGSKEDNKKLVHSLFQAEYRWWMCERFAGHFLGAHALFAHYNVGQKQVPLLFDKEYHYEGYAYGVGFSYGYNLPLSRRWGLEFTVGLGAAYLSYDRYDCGFCGRTAGKDDKFYFGPTKLGVNLVFLIR